jgi:allantoinase
MNNFALRSKRVITPHGVKDATIIINHGVIEAILPYETDIDCELIDHGNLVIMPGLVDTHVHINEPGRTDWEGFNTATQAAAAGGITTLVDMPLNCIPATVTKKALDIKLQALKGKLWVDCGFWGGVIPESLENNGAQLDELLSAGVLGAKSFLIHSGVDEFPNVSADDVKKALPIMAKYQVPYLIHAELDKAHNEPQEIGDKYQSFLDSRPRSWENDAIDLMVSLGEEAKEVGVDAHIHIVHLSSSDALEKIIYAKNAGLKFTAETCPHYLTLFSEEIPDGKTLFKCCPPIREDENRQKLWQALKAGDIDFIVSDHSPCTPELKKIDSGDLENAWGGISALQFGLPLIWTEAKQRGFTLSDISHLMSTATAEFVGLDDKKGKIAVGAYADILVFDDEKEVIISSDMIKHKHKITPYVGKKVTGEVNKTYLRGQLVYSEQDIMGQPQGNTLLKHNY